MKRAPKSAKVVVLENNDPIAAEAEAIQSRIRRRAWELSQTRPTDAQEIYDWIIAESEIISIPPAELIEKDSIFEVRFAVAGVNLDDVNVMVTPDQILIKSEFSHQHDSQSGTVHLCDFKSATVFRSISLPQPIDVKTVKVSFTDGMILVTASKEGSNRKAPAKKTMRAKAGSRGFTQP